MCPVCSAGVIIGLGLSRWLKVDDVITGLWVGAFILVISFWTFKWIFRKKEHKPTWILFLILILYFLLTFVPLYKMNVIDNIWRTILGINRLLFGSICGLILSSCALSVDRLLRRKNSGRVAFKYQKVILPLSTLIIFSLIFGLLLK